MIQFFLNLIFSPCFFSIIEDCTAHGGLGEGAWGESSVTRASGPATHPSVGTDRGKSGKGHGHIFPRPRSQTKSSLMQMRLEPITEL